MLPRNWRGLVARLFASREQKGKCRRKKFLLERLEDRLAPALSINDVMVDEAGGTATFTVTLDAPSGLTVTAIFATTDGTALAGEDYAGTTGTVTFAPGVTSQPITVNVLDDTID